MENKESNIKRRGYDVEWGDIAKANAAIDTLPIARRNKRTGTLETKDYAEVNQRVKAFRMVYPTGFIHTTMAIDGNMCTFRAECGFYTDAGPVVLANGTAYEMRDSSPINATSFIENCETSAVGRALGMAGFGIETSICSAEELQNALCQQEQQQRPPIQPREPIAPAVDTPEDAEYRAKVRSVYDILPIDDWCKRNVGLPFDGTPVSILKRKLPEEKVDERIAARKAEQEATTNE